MPDESVLTEENLVDRFAQTGLDKEIAGNTAVYFLDASRPENSKQSLQSLKEVLTGRRIAVEIGPGNQLSSLIFAGKYSQADVVIGIDPNFDINSIDQPEVTGEKTPPIILVKSDAWGNTEINKLFGAYESDRSKRLATYSQLVAPDTLAAERMMAAAVPLSKGGFMLVLDSGAVDFLKQSCFPEDDIHRIILAEIGLTNPSHFDWVKYQYRHCEQMEIDKEDYERGMLEGKYPPSRFLRTGRMLVIQKPLLEAIAV